MSAKILILELFALVINYINHLQNSLVNTQVHDKYWRGIK